MGRTGRAPQPLSSQSSCPFLCHRHRSPGQVIIDTFFGFAPSLNASAPVLADPATPRGFAGTLANVRLADGSVVNIVSNSDGVHVEAQ